jgi:hypothetical protein
MFKKNKKRAFMPVSSSLSDQYLFISPHSTRMGLQELGAGTEIRTRDTKLGTLVLYQLSYARIHSRNTLLTK